LLETLEERVMVMDGATGTGLQAANLTAEDFGGSELEGCNENLCLTRPDVIEQLHASYLEAGADIVETNSFGGTPLVLAEYGLEEKAFELNREAARLARVACARFDEPGRLRFVCGSMGPTTKAISVTGGVTFEELREHYRVQALGLMAGGADYLLLETCQDTRNIKAGAMGILEAFDEAGWRLPVAVSVTIEATGTMLAGQDAEALAVSLLHRRSARRGGAVPRGSGGVHRDLQPLLRPGVAQPRGRMLWHQTGACDGPGRAGCGPPAPAHSTSPEESDLRHRSGGADRRQPSGQPQIQAAGGGG
jgi:methionine synthase I (cobalamin-dependent)